MKRPLGSSPDAETRQRLLLAAGSVFAERGFRNVSVREICRRARANVAAVNYHFGDKMGIYKEVLRYALRRASEKYPPSQGLPPGAPAQRRLEAFIHSFLLRIFDEGPQAWHGKLIAREMIEPTAALDALVKEQIQARADLLEGIVKELLGARVDRSRLRLCALSIVGQCLFYHHARAMLVRLYPCERYEGARVEELAEHITQFSLGALRALRAKKETK